MGCGIVVERLFSWDYENKEKRAAAIKAQIAERNAVCVMSDHNWAHSKYSLEVYAPVYREDENFKGGIYEEIESIERDGLDAAEAYEVLAEIVREGFPVRFHFDAKWKHLTIFRFRPKNN